MLAIRTWWTIVIGREVKDRLVQEVEFCRGWDQLSRRDKPHACRGEMGTAADDGSNGYEAVANIYIAGRGTRSRVGDSVGAAVVKAWADAFPPGATVLDHGSGPGEPSTRILQEADLTTYAVEASPTMVAAFRERFPDVPIERSTVEASEFFNQTFGGVLAWGLLFLLNPTSQALVIEKVARALAPQVLSLHRTPGAPEMVGRHDRASVAIPR